MDMMIKAMLAMVWMLVIPLGIGKWFSIKKDGCFLSEYFIKGYLFEFSLAEIMILLMIYLEMPLHVLVWSYGAVLFIVTLAGYFGRGKWKVKDFLLEIHEKKKELWAYFAAVILILLQIMFVVLYAHMDADDSMYVGAATTAVYTDTIYSVNPYTGMLYETLPSRYVLSPFPVFLAIMSQLSGGLHPAIMAHMFFPFAFMMLVYAVMAKLAKKWFSANVEAQGIFILCVAIMNWFSAYSVYNAGNFQMVRLWQGKALLASALLPLIYCVASSLMLEKNSEIDSWSTLFMLNLSCCLVSSMGIMMSIIAIVSMAAISLLKEKNIKKCFCAGLCCVPSFVLGVIYILMK